MGKVEIKNLILLVIIDIIALSLAPAVGTAVVAAQADASITGSNDTLVGLVTLLYCVCIVGANIGVLWKMFKD